VSEILHEYIELLQEYIDGRIPVDAFRTRYFKRFKGESRPLREELYLVLDRAFGELECFTTDPELLAANPSLYLDEAALRALIRRDLLELDQLLSKGC